MLNVNEAIAVIYVAHEIEKLKEVLETRVGVPTELIIELQNKVVAAGNYAVFARYKQGPAYSWFYNLQRQVADAAKVTDRYNPSPVRKGDDPTNSRDDRNFDQAFEDDDELGLERLMIASGLLYTEDELDTFSNLTMAECKAYIDAKIRRTHVTAEIRAAIRAEGENALNADLARARAARAMQAKNDAAEADFRRENIKRMARIPGLPGSGIDDLGEPCNCPMCVAVDVLQLDPDFGKDTL
jgi:hypothetical protein